MKQYKIDSIIIVTVLCYKLNHISNHNDIVHRFMTFVPSLEAVPDARSDGYALIVQTKEVSTTISRSAGTEKVLFPELRAILDVFISLLHAQTLLKAANKVTFPPVMPVPERLKWQLTFLGKSVSFVASNFEQILVPCELIVTLPRKTFFGVRKIPYFNI